MEAVADPLSRLCSEASSVASPLGSSVLAPSPDVLLVLLVPPISACVAVASGETTDASSEANAVGELLVVPFAPLALVELVALVAAVAAEPASDAGSASDVSICAMRASIGPRDIPADDRLAAAEVEPTTKTRGQVAARLWSGPSMDRYM